VPCRQPGQGACVQRVPQPARGDHHRDLAAGLDAGGACGVAHDLQRGGEPADQRRVGGGVDLQLQAPRALGGGLVDQPPHVVLGAHAGPGRLVQALEPEPAPPVRRDAQQVVIAERTGQAQPGRERQVRQGAGAHRPREVQVQVRLGQGAQVADGFGHRRRMPARDGADVPRRVLAPRRLSPRAGAGCARHPPSGRRHRGRRTAAGNRWARTPHPGQPRPRPCRG